MADSYIERNDLAAAKSEAFNEYVYGPSMISSIQDNFGAPSATLFIYNVAPLYHTVNLPPNHPGFFIKACPHGEKYVIAGKIEHPFKEVTYDQNGEMGIRLKDAKIEASKMLNPVNPGTNQDFETNEGDALHYGINLNALGCFWSANNPPLEEELEKAHKRLEKTLRKELQDMVAIEAKEGADGARARANNISRAAANYFNQSFSWHRLDLVPKGVNEAKIDCWLCAEKIQAKAKVCIHCGIKQTADEAEQAKLMEQKFAEKRGPGRPLGS